MKDYVKKDIQERKVTISKYASLLGVIPDTIYRWKRGDLEPSKRCLILMQFSNEQLEAAHEQLEKLCITDTQQKD